MSWAEWVLGIVATAVAAKFIWFIRLINQLPVQYVPRAQLQERLASLESRFIDDLKSQEARVERRFNRLETQIDTGFQRVMDKIEGKADK